MNSEIIKEVIFWIVILTLLGLLMITAIVGNNRLAEIKIEEIKCKDVYIVPCEEQKVECILVNNQTIILNTNETRWIN